MTLQIEPRKTRPTEKEIPQTMIAWNTQMKEWETQGGLLVYRWWGKTYTMWFAFEDIPNPEVI